MDNADKNSARLRFNYLFSLLLVATTVFIGCRGNAVSPPVSLPNREVTDDLRRSVSVPARITRAVSLAPSVTENIFAIGGGDRLVGVTTYCNYPEQAKAIAKVGDTLNPNLETIISLKPEVVFVSTASQIEAFTNTLTSNGVAVYVLDPVGLDGVMKDLQQLGDLFGTGERAEKVVTDLERRISNVSEMVNGKKPVRLFVQFSNEPLFTIGKESFLNEVINKAGGISVTADVETAFPKLSKETAAALQPELIILSQSDDNREANEAFKGSPAVKGRRVYSINADLLSRPGPRLVDAMEQIAEKMYQ
jgi:ABC-type Fe3+-hydroxamate transport system substrate-binding protein